MHRRAFLATGVATVAGGCLTVLGDGESEYDVGMTPKAFDPELLEVTTGTTVVWKNTSSRGHTVTAFQGRIPEDADYFATGGFESEAAARDAWDDTTAGIIDGGETFEYTVEVPGTYEYVCLPHERSDMVGRIEVTD